LGDIYLKFLERKIGENGENKEIVRKIGF